MGKGANLYVFKTLGASRSESMWTVSTSFSEKPSLRSFEPKYQNILASVIFTFQFLSIFVELFKHIFNLLEGGGAGSAPPNSKTWTDCAKFIKIYKTIKRIDRTK